MEGFRCLVPLEVQWRDLDGLAHVNNATYLSYLETARLHYLSRVWQLESRQPHAVPFVIAEATVRYHAPAYLGDRLTVGVRARRIRTGSFLFEYRIEREPEGTLIATGRTLQVGYDPLRRRVAPFPESWLARMRAFEGEAGGGRGEGCPGATPPPPPAAQERPGGRPN